MTPESAGASARSASGRRSWATVALAAVLLVLGLGGASLAAWEAVERLRVDTPVQAVAEGEPGCVNRAVLTGPDGVRRSVDVTRYKADCLDLDPGASVTVYVDASDPSVVSASRAWWWSTLGALVGLVLAGLAGCSGAPPRAPSGRRSPADHPVLTARSSPVVTLVTWPRSARRTSTSASTTGRVTSSAPRSAGTDGP